MVREDACVEYFTCLPVIDEVKPLMLGLDRKFSSKFSLLPLSKSFEKVAFKKKPLLPVAPMNSIEP